MAYFDTKSGSLEEAIRQAVGGKINEAKVVMDLENDDPKLMKDIKGFGLKVKDLGDSGNKGYNEYEISGPQSKIDAASKKLNLQASYHEKLDPVNKKALKKDFDDRKDKDIDNDGDVDSSDKYLAKRRKAVSKAMKKEESISEAVGKDIAKKMMGSKTMKGFASKVAKMKTVTKGDLEKMLPDYVAGADISKLFETDTTENYDIGTPENTKAKLDATPGQSSDDWNQQVETMQKKNSSMREALAKMWGVEEGHNPFDKKEEKKYNKDKNETKTMTGKPMTKVSVDPDMKEKKK